MVLKVIGSGREQGIFIEIF